MTLKKLIILGTGGNAYDVLDIVDAINEALPTWTVAGFLDDRRAAGTLHAGHPILGSIDQASRWGNDHWFINAVGSDKSYTNRPDVASRAGVLIDRYVTLVHPQAAVSVRARLGRGTWVNAGASVAGAVRIGDHVNVGPGCIIGHDSVIGDDTMLAPGSIVSGFVTVENNCYIGAGAMIKQCITIGARALVGMGAVVTREVEPETTVIGCPARPIAVAAGGKW